MIKEYLDLVLFWRAELSFFKNRISDTCQNMWVVFGFKGNPRINCAHFFLTFDPRLQLSSSSGFGKSLKKRFKYFRIEIQND